MLRCGSPLFISDCPLLPRGLRGSPQDLHEILLAALHELSFALEILRLIGSRDVLYHGAVHADAALLDVSAGLGAGLAEACRHQDAHDIDAAILEVLVLQGIARDVRAVRAAAEQGDAQAQYQLGQCYEKGLGTAVDSAQAVQWYTRAAEQGDADAMYSLGLCYYYAIGVPEDLAKARAYLRKAIATGKLDTMKVYTANALMGIFGAE